LFFNQTYSMPAYPYRIPISVDGDSVCIRLFGDEHCKWAETEEGRTIIQTNDNCWWYARKMEDGNLEKSAYKFTTSNYLETGLKDFLKNTPLHLRPLTNKHTTYSQSIRAKVIGERRVLVILMAFNDLAFKKSRDDFDQLFNMKGYFKDGAQGSVKDYYLSASYNQLELTSDIYGPYVANHNMGYYGNNATSGSDINPRALFEEAIEAVSKEIDLKVYDGDGDGFLDNIHIIYAGYGEEAGASASAIWAHESTFSKPYTIQNVKIDKYSCAPELRGNSGNGISRIGPHCHEIGHALGAMDYYDTNYATDGQFSGTGQWDVMGQGSWNYDGICPADFNPYVKAFNYGWVVPKILPKGQVTISPSNFGAEYYILSSSEDGDYYLMENRSKDMWGMGLPGHGLLLYHIHQDIANTRNKINVSSPQKCYIVCASSKSKKPSDSPSSYGEINSAGCPYPGSSQNTSFFSESTPSAFFWTSDVCGIDIQNIKQLDNGDILFQNNSNGVDYEPFALDCLYEESFEDEEHFRLIDSKNGQWMIIEDAQLSEGLINRPLAHSGEKSLQLSAYDSFWDNAISSIEFDCMPKFTNGTVYVSGFFTSWGLSHNIYNTLRLGYLSSTGEWIYSELKSSSNITWNSFTFSFESIPLMRFRIEGEAKAGTILALDDILITEKEISTQIENGISNKESQYNPSIYKLDGTQHQVFTNGLNIIRMPSGQFKKIFLKSR